MGNKWFLALACFCVATASHAQMLSEAEEMERAQLIVGPENTDDDCASCHSLEHEAWQTTRHYATFKDRHRSAEAREILANLELRSMKREPECRQCHYTSTVKGERLSPEWGVSCESCHGPAGNWINIHNRPGGDPDADAMEWGDGALEDAAQREARMEAAADAGMLHPERLYDIASNCFGCHTVPDERLVNVGKHHWGKPFDLVARTQGEIRHNFLHATADSGNPPASPEDLRRLYVVGTMVDLEFALRNLARVTKPGGDFDVAMRERVTAARTKARAILEQVALPELDAAVSAIPDTIASWSPEAALIDSLAQATRDFVAAETSDLAALDALLPGEYVGEPLQP